MELTRVLEQINNLDSREAVRQFGPKWSIVVVSPSLQVVAVGRYKVRPSLLAVDELLAPHRGCAYFYATPGMYDTRDALESRVQACEEAFRDR